MPPKKNPASTKPEFSTTKKSGLIKCLRCDVEYDFPSDHCDICGQHCYTIFMLDVELTGGVRACSQCWNGRWKVGRDWHRKRGTWKPDPFFPSSWDDPEWYDLNEEWKNTTLQFVWNENDNNIDEL